MNDINTGQQADMAQEGAQAGQQEQQLGIQRIFITDASLESPNAPAVFQQKEWKPKLHIDLNTDSKALGDNLYLVVLKVTVTVKSEDMTAFIAEVHQAGIFTIQGLNDEQLRHCLGSYCPNILYPYAREAITDMVTRASFPQLVLAPVNFDRLYAQSLAEQQKEAAGEEGAAGGVQ